MKNRPDDIFGLCPKCKNEAECLNVGKNHWNACRSCKTCWPIGYNLFSSWQYETEQDWKRNAELLQTFTEVKPYYYPVRWHVALRKRLSAWRDRIVLKYAKKLSSAGTVPF